MANGKYIEIDENDPFEGVRLQAVASNGTPIVVGEIMEGNGRYELRKVDEDDE